MCESSHVEISIKVNPAYSDVAVQFLMDDFGCNGVITEEIHYNDEQVISKEIDIVKGYFPNEINNFLDENEIKNKIENKRNQLALLGISKEELGSWAVSLRIIPDEKWATAWKKHWHPQKIGSKIVICPSWEKYELAENEILIELDPGSAFGTGTHPTTRLCVIALEKYVKQGCSVADVGTGSGILAITAIKLGAAHITGVDNDASVIKVAKDNAQKNNVLSQTNFFHGSAVDIKERIVGRGCTLRVPNFLRLNLRFYREMVCRAGYACLRSRLATTSLAKPYEDGVPSGTPTTKKFDILAANILHNVIVEMMEDLHRLVKPGGIIILSGIIKEKEEFVLNCAISYGLEHVETFDDENWVGIILKK